MLTLGSLFDGIGGFCLAAQRHGIAPVWASEIEPSCLAITKRHFPQVKQLGDITKIQLGDVPSVDIITFGSPCQDLSVAGKRAGLEGERSGLFHAAVQLIRRLRERDGKPEIIVWENVPGALSSNDGEDFRKVLEEIAETEIPTPRNGRWSNAGLAELQSCQLCWRILDAQFWGVPQRRRRIFLVCDFSGRRAGKILFECESQSGDFKQGEGAREAAAAGIGKGSDKSDCVYAVDMGGGKSKAGVSENITPPLTTTHGGEPVVCKTIGFDANASRNNNAPMLADIAPPLKTTNRIAVFENHGQDSRYKGPLEVAPVVHAKFGTGGNNTPLVVQEAAGFKLGAGSQAGSLGYQKEVAPTLSSMDSGNKPAVVCFAQQSYSGFKKADVGATLKVKCGRCSGGSENLTLTKSIVRRLMPLECERLQGYPDNYTEGQSDSARYKALGNSVALPCVEFIMAGIKREW